MKPSYAKDRLASAAKAYIEVHFTEKFSLDQIADELFINKNYLSRVFREATGFTPLWYHNHLRCETAKKMLQDPSVNIAFVASETGFSSASHFTRVFKDYTGITPSEYRSRCD